MNTAIVYSTKHGTTEKVAHLLADKLENDQVTLLNLHQAPAPSLAPFARVIVGGSIHMGTIQEELRHFCAEHEAELLQKELGLFICCLQQEKQQEQFENAFPKRLREHSIVNGCLGGELLLEKMHLLDKLIVRVVANAKKSTSALDYDAIDRFAVQLLQHQQPAC